MGQGGHVPGSIVETVIVVHGSQGCKVGQGWGVGQLCVVISAVVVEVVVAVVVVTSKNFQKTQLWSFFINSLIIILNILILTFIDHINIDAIDLEIHL